jgi:hypothetical protein
VESDLARTDRRESTDGQRVNHDGGQGIRGAAKVSGAQSSNGQDRRLVRFDVRESYEMLYQSEAPYLFDSSKFAAAFGFEPTSYARGVHLTAAAYALAAS